MRARQQHTKALRGFTLVEVMVVLAISAIVAAVTIPSAVSWYDSYKGTERQANAELIYTTAQNSMAQLKASGQLGNYDNGSGEDKGRVTLAANTRTGSFADSSKLTASTSAQAADASMIALNSDDANGNGDADAKKIASALNLLVPDVAGQLSNVGFSSVSYATDAHYRVELNPKTGYVYRVFFSENAIDGKTYQDAAAAAATIEDSQASDADKSNAQNTLNNLKVNYYGGTTAASFVDDEQEPVRGVGYFEFAQTGDDSAPQAQVTGGYYYRINSDNSVSPDATDALANDNDIDEDAKAQTVEANSNAGDSSVVSPDGTAYGVLVLASDVQNHNITVPTDVKQTPYMVTRSSKMTVDGKKTDDSRTYYFYKLNEPESSAQKQTTYRIVYQIYNTTDNPYWPHYEDVASTIKQGGIVGKTAKVTHGDLGPVSSYLQNGWGFASDSVLEDVVQDYGNTTLYVRLRQDSTTHTLPHQSPYTSTLENGTGVWYPWSTADNSQLQGIAFYVNQNFAAAISKNDKDDLGTKLQVRTAQQLQHIGSPYGSRSKSSGSEILVADYLKAKWSFYQTHNITIDDTWIPIGQHSATNIKDSNARTDSQFTGNFYGGYSGYNSNDHSDLDKPNRRSQTFAITLASHTSEEAPSSNHSFGFKEGSQEYTTDDGYRSYGIFGYVSGTVEYVNVHVGEGPTDSNADGRAFAFTQTLADPHYGTLVGDLHDGTVSHSSVVIAKNSSLNITQSGSSGNPDGATAVGGLCGNMNGTARLADSSLTLEKADSAAADGNERFKLTSDANWSSSKATNTGGLVGRADCSNGDTGQSFIENCTLALNDDARINAGGESSGVVNMGGFVASSLGNGTITNCKMTVAKQLNLGTPSSTSWGPNVSAGGFIGAAGDTDSSTDQQATPRINTSTLSVGTDGQVSIETAFANANPLTLGGFAGRVTERASLANDAITNDGTLNISGSVSDSGSISFGGFAGTVSTDTKAPTSGESTHTVQSCHVTGDGSASVHVGESGVEVHAGGFTGTLSNGAAVSDSAINLSGDINVTSDNAKQAATDVGGFAGMVQDNAATTSTGVTSSQGSLTVQGTTTRSGQTNVGGMFGILDNNANVSKSTLETGKAITVTSESQAEAYAGGIVGIIPEKAAAIDHATLTAGDESKITASSPTHRYAGGIIGSLPKGATVTAPVLNAKGDLQVSTTGVDGDYGASYTGGLFGYAAQGSGTSTISGAKATADGNVTLDGSSTSNAYVGGLAGKTDSISFDTPNLTFSKDLSVTSNGGGNNTERAGGLVGSAAGTASMKSPTLQVDGKLTATAPKSASATAYAAGMFGNVEGTTAITDPTLNVHEAEISSDSSNKAYSGGIAAELEGASTVSGAEVNIGREKNRGNLATSATGSDGASAYTAGLIGRIASTADIAVSNAEISIEGDSSLASTSGDGTYVGSLAGSIESTRISNARVSLSDGMQVQGSGGKHIYAGGLIGRMSSAEASYLSLLGPKDASGKPSISVNASGNDNPSPENGYVGGLLGNAEKSHIENSYLAARQATLQLNNSIDKDDVYTGGFAGQMEADSDERGAAFCYVYADIRSDHNRGISAFVDRFDKALMRSCFVVGTMADNNDNALDNAYAFARKSSFGNEYRERPAGDYAAVTDAHGNTPYTFLNWKPEDDDNISTPGCVIYNAKAADPTRENDPKGRTGKRAYGAHEVSYNWLTGNATYDEAYNTTEFNKEDDPYYYPDFPTYLKSKNKAAERYPYVSVSDVESDYRDAGSHYGLPGSNPFPTATRDADGNYVNYGKWIPKP